MDAAQEDLVFIPIDLPIELTEYFQRIADKEGLALNELLSAILTKQLSRYDDNGNPI